MTTTASIRQSDIRRMALIVREMAVIARDMGVVVEIERNGFDICIRPDHPEERDIARKPEIRL